MQLYLYSFSGVMGAEPPYKKGRRAGLDKNAFSFTFKILSTFSAKLTKTPDIN